MKKYLLKSSLLTASVLPVIAVVSCSKDKVQEKTNIDTSNLIGDSFVIWGNEGAGKVGMKTSKKLPPEIEVKYFVGKTESVNDSDYKKSLGIGLSKDDKVHIKFFIKEANTKTHKFPSNFKNKISMTVATLTNLITYMDISKLNENSYQFLGSDGTGKLAKKTGITFPDEILIKYAKGATVPENEGGYSIDIPSSLSIGEKIYIKFFIKIEKIATHKFPGNFDTNPITITVKEFVGLLHKISIDTTKLVSASFEVTGNEGTGGLDMKASVTLPIEVEAKFYKGATASSNDLDYTQAKPTSLSNGDKIYIKFFIKVGKITTHKFPTSFIHPIEFTITGL